MEKLESKVKNAIDKYGLINKNERVLVGLSGGADSVALLHVLLKIAPERGFELCAAHLNHGIRGAEAYRDQRFVQELCKGLGVPLICLGDKLPNGLLILIMIVAAIAAGALWGFLPAFFKARWNTNETLFTLMMNYIATQLAAYYIIVWEVPKGAGKIGIINQNTNAGWLPQIAGKQYLLTILVVAVLTVLTYIYLKYSKHGYEIAVVGESQRTASYAGIKVERVIIRTMVLSGAMCGLMGLLLTAGTDHTLTTTIVGGRGFTAVMVSWMAKFNPIMMIFTSLLLVVLSRGASEISSVFGLNHSFADILTGIILFFIIGSEFFINYKVSLRKAGKKEA